MYVPDLKILPYTWVNKSMSTEAFISLTQINKDLSKTAWIVKSGQKIVFSELEVRSQKYIWHYDVSECRQLNVIIKNGKNESIKVDSNPKKNAPYLLSVKESRFNTKD